MSRPFPPRSSFNQNSGTRINGRIRAREVRVIGDNGQQVGVLTLQDALAMARGSGVDLVEVAPNATPPVCRLVDYGKYRYEQAKREKDAKKHQHANKVKEIQLSAKIDPHDMSVKLSHAIDFLCEEMKVKVSLRFRGREMAHTEVGFDQITKFTRDVAGWGHPDNQAKLVGRGITVMFSPLPRNKRAKNPHENSTPADGKPAAGQKPPGPAGKGGDNGPGGTAFGSAGSPGSSGSASTQPDGFQINPFSNLSLGNQPPGNELHHEE